MRVLCDLIIPADDHSGSATAAGVPEFIDDWLDFRKREDGNDMLDRPGPGRPHVARPGIPHLIRKGVCRRGARRSKSSILDRVAWPAKAAPEDHRWVAWFNRFRDLTASGFFSSKMGVADLPYLGNRAVAEWKGCDPKVWAVIEERMKNGYKGWTA